MNNDNYDWQSIAALNLSSTLAQVGQFGIPFVVLPLWMALHGADTAQLSLFASSLWLGQFPGLAFAPSLSRRYGAKAVIVLALLSTALALCAMAWGSSVLWLPAGVVAGFGQGLRWIGLEPWLYRIAPGHARGRLVGFHETLIAFAPIIAPLLAAVWGLDGSAPLWLGIGFVSLAVVPLFWAHEHRDSITLPAIKGTAPPTTWRFPKERMFVVGVAIALVGGMSEAAFIGLFPVFGMAHQRDAQQIATLLTTFGAGGFLFQYAAGWLADHRGMLFTCMGCCAGTAVVACVLTLDLNLYAMYAAIFCLGGLLTAYLTLALIASAKTVGGNMASNMSVISMVYTLSAVMGPLIAGGAVNVWGGDGLMWALALLAISMTGYLARLARSAATAASSA